MTRSAGGTSPARAVFRCSTDLHFHSAHAASALVTNVTTHPTVPGVAVVFWTLVLVAFVPQYIIAPILLRRRRGNLPTKLIPVDPSFPPPARIAEWLERTRRALESEGFVLAPGGGPMASGSSRSGYIQLFQHPARHDLAVAIAMDGPPPANRQVRNLYFVAEFGDGTRWTTANSPTPGVAPNRPGIERCRFPAEQDPARHYALHRAAVARTGKSQRQIPLRDAMLYQQEEERKSRQWMVDSGYYWLDGERLRATWKGAFLAVWHRLPPLSTLEARRNERLRRELLAQI